MLIPEQSKEKIVHNQMPISTAKDSDKKKREYWIDWPKIFIIHIVVLQHSFNAANTMTGYTDRDPILKQRKEFIDRWFFQIGMTIMFFYGGMSAGKFNTLKSGGWLRYTLARVNRLVKPLIFCFFALQIPRQYFT